MLARFFLLFTIAYVILFIPASGFDKVYESFFRMVGNKTFSHIGDGGVVIIQPQKNKNFDSRIFISKESLRDGNSYHGETYDLSAYLMGFLPTIFFLALVVATPLSWRRKAVAIAGGLVIVTAYVMLKLRIFILYSFSQTVYLGLYQDTRSKESISFWTDHFASQKTIDYSFILIVWMALFIGKREWQRMNAAVISTDAGSGRSKSKSKPKAAKKF